MRKGTEWGYRTCGAVVGMAATAAAHAQSASELGGSTLQQVCQALGSPLIVLAFVIAIVAAVITVVLEGGTFPGGKGKTVTIRLSGTWLTGLIIGAAVILGIGTIVSMLGLTGHCSVL